MPQDQKKAFSLKEKAFLITFEGLSLKQIKTSFLEGESPTLNLMVTKG